MSWQANAEPRIGPTRPARSRTMLALSLAAAPSPASTAQDKKKIAQRVFIAVDPRLCFFVGWKYVLGAAIARSGTMLFELDCLVLPAFIKRRAPYLVRSLVFAAAEVERGSKAQVEIARVLQDVDELLGIELRPSPLQRLDQDVCRNVTLQRAVVRASPGKYLARAFLYSRTMLE